MPRKPAISDAPGPGRCPRCGTEVACGARAGQCWCFDWPQLPAQARLDAEACLCPACLRAALLAVGATPEDSAADVSDTGAQAAPAVSPASERAS
ncbi:hypothetical protein AB870_25730 [Pandoraea faecigallinarum]|uniref:Cysteine-rich CWC family protein n=1 Tax=Pandoraea faecigallinarum TaxID=656179 RepID=A0A173H017_9BURK|nr:cysteine-rich CWC family protein [Pandoraea faecigallinarum]ANI21631.1 hypothetical protein AB870_25730 [Pandoraea faecigallinarum]